MLNFCCGTDLTEKQFNGVFKERIKDFGSYYFIVKFLKFQYPKGLNSEKPAIIGVKNELFSLNNALVFDVIKESLGNDYLIVKDKDKDKDKDKGITVKPKTSVHFVGCKCPKCR